MKLKSKSQKGVTLTSLAIYIVLVLVTLGILAVISGLFQSNIKEIYKEGMNNSEIDKFNVSFLKEVKKQGNEISTILDNEILFTTGNKYTFKSDNIIYLNDGIKVAENIEKCVFSYNLENGKTVITVIIKAINGEEKIIQYVLNNETIEDNDNNESDYTNYIPKNWDVSKLNSNNSAYSEIIDNNIYIAPIPKGFVISGAETENTIKNGLVIYKMTEEEKEGIDWTDSTQLETAKQTYNQFVWIPVTDSATYTEDSLGPLTGDFTDSYQTIQKLYGNALGEITDEASFNKIFTYAEDKTNIETSVRKYGGFYVGRYETTYDSTNVEGVPQGIGVKRGKNLLNANNILQSGTNANNSNKPYYYRWWGLYKAQKDMYTENEAVFSTMITSKEWDAIMSFTGYDTATRAANTYTTTPALSGSAYKDVTPAQYDVSKNIYDLAGNVFDLTLTVNGTSIRLIRGGSYVYDIGSASNSTSVYPYDSESFYRF